MPNTELGIYWPDDSSQYAYSAHLATMAASTDTAIVKRSWYYVGTEAQRLALGGDELRNGIIFEDVVTGEIWQHKGGSWASKDLVRNLGRIAPVTSGNQTGITATRTEINGTAISITLAAPTLLRFYANFKTQSSSVADVAFVNIMDGSTVVFHSIVQVNSSPSMAPTGRTQLILTDMVIPAGLHNFTLAITRGVGPGSISVIPDLTSPTSFSIDRIG